MTKHAQHWLLLAGLLTAAAPAAHAEPLGQGGLGASVERQLPHGEPLMQWTQDPAALAADHGDRLEKQEVVVDGVKIVKLRNVVPPIHFASGVAQIPDSTIERLRRALDGMRHLQNVRLHLVGHADSQPLSDALAGVFGDNAGLSEERAGEVADFIQTRLMLPPGSISFEWAGDTQPIASNATEEGRAQNRRVEVEVWYDEKDATTAVQDVVIPGDTKRIEVCRTQTLCKLRYLEGHARRARLRNLIAPLHFGDDTVGVPEAFVGQIRQALLDLRGEQNVTVKFIGFTDDVPLEGRAERIYGTELALSKARARRVALAVQEALALPPAAVASDGRGAEQPLASNETERGRALNRRIEVEFWHDDPLQELPEEPTLCPDAPAAEVVTRVYDPPWGPLAPLAFEDGHAVVPSGYPDELRRAMSEIADRTNVRLRFVGFTGNEPLDRRTAAVYGDDIGLSVSRAYRTMEEVKGQLALTDAQVEHEGRGYVHADDVVNAGFLAGDRSFIRVEVVYDELAVLDDQDGIEVTRLHQELEPQDPLALNVMRISVDGEPIDDPGRSSADVQRCTDVALERTDIDFRFDGLTATPRLSVIAQPNSVLPPATVRFRTYTNYPHFIERSEIRLFEQGRSLQSEPLAVIAVGSDGLAEWQPPTEPFPAPVRELQYVVRAYGKDGQFDETDAQTLWLVEEGAAPPPAAPPAPPAGEAKPALDPLLAGYGESGIAIQTIPLGNVGTVRVQGRGIPPEHQVFVAGQPVPVDANGEFIAEAILPAGLHTVEVAVLDAAGNGELFLRDLELPKTDLFYVGLADLTFSHTDTSGPANELEGANDPQDADSSADGRLAFYVDGKLREDWKLTASADTKEGPVNQLFTNFVDKSPGALLRRIDPDYTYPTFGDDSVVEETAPTLGKFFVKVSNRESHAMWGNFEVEYLDNELAQVDRGLYGGQAHYQTVGTTRFGEQRLAIDGFGADPGTVPSREEFLGTGGSLYFLRHQDILQGSDRVRIEVRDKDTGLVWSVSHLRPVLDYDIDYIQGRILLTEPLSPTVSDDLLVRTGGLSGAEAYLVVQYEFTPGFESLDAMSSGGQGHYWFNDFVRVGVTANDNNLGDEDSSVYATDLTLRKTTDSWFKLQAGRSQGLVSNSLLSEDGGFEFTTEPAFTVVDDEANAFRGDLNVGIGDIFAGAKGQLSLYAQDLGAGYSAPGQLALTDTFYWGGLLRMPLTDRLRLAAKADTRHQTDALETDAQELNLGYQLTENWSLGGGVRHENREDNAAIILPTQEVGSRTDAVIQLGFDTLAKWRSYGFVQETLERSGNREDNGRVGVGGAYRLTDKLRVEGEVSHGDLGPGVKVGTTYQQSPRTALYLNYALEDERTDNGMHVRGANLIAGARSRISDSTSVHVERRQQMTDEVSGLMHSSGITLSPTERWNLGANVDVGNLFNLQTGAEIKRRAGGARVGYGFGTVQLSSGFEYRYDEMQQLTGQWTDRTTWLFRNTMKNQTTPDWRVVGKLNWSDSDSSEGEFFDGGYREGIIGLGYRPVKHDRFDALAKYTYFYNIPATDQFDLPDPNTNFIQQSQIASLDVTYDLTADWSIGGKYAYRLGQVSLDRVDPDFFDNNAHLGIVRLDYRFLDQWEASLEGRLLDLPDVDETKSGALFTIYRYVGEHLKVGVGYNFTDFSDDLTDLSYDRQGVFLNVVGTL